MSNQLFLDKHLIGDPALMQIMAYYRCECKPFAYKLPYGDMVISLKPHEVLFDFSLFESSYKIAKDILMSKLRKLEELGRATLDQKDEYALMQFDEKFVPIDFAPSSCNNS